MKKNLFSTQNPEMHHHIPSLPTRHTSQALLHLDRCGPINCLQSPNVKIALRSKLRLPIIPNPTKCICEQNIDTTSSSLDTSPKASHTIQSKTQYHVPLR